MMQANEIWRSKEAKHFQARILGKNKDGSVALTFEVSKLHPKRIHNFQADYLEQWYESTGSVQTWKIDPALAGNIRMA